MEIREACYFCTSTFQLFPIISLVLSRSEKADLYIDPQFKAAHIYAERIRSLGVFESVIVIRHEEIMQRYFSHRKGFLNHVQIARSYLHVDKIAKEILGTGILYKKIFVSSKAYLPRMVILYHLRQSQTCTTVYHFDDGVGSYYGDGAYKPQRLDYLLRYLLFGEKGVSRVTERFLFSPDVYIAINGRDSLDVHALTRIWESPYGANIVNRIFEGAENEKIKEPIIVLEEPYTDIFSDKAAAKLTALYEDIILSCGVEKSIIKKHPRSIKGDNPKFNYYSNYEIPFEALCMNLSMNDKTLVSYGSTAVATPKLLFDKEPYVIMLYKLLGDNSSVIDTLDAFFSTIKKNYSTDKFFIPSTEQELYASLKIVKESIQ